MTESSKLSKAVLVHVEINSKIKSDNINEFIELCTSAGTSAVATFNVTINSPNAKLYIGSGKVEEIFNACELYEPDIVIFDCQLSPSQERNLEKILKRRVLDRTGLILDIFAQRARTYEGKLQVELAQLQYMSTRLIRGWTHLERQKGGIGLRGPGETQLETDRRLLRERIKHINKLLNKVEKQRAQSRSARAKSQVPIVSLVGYTNAGKSTLFNLLTESEIYVADQLFATLDTTIRKLTLNHGKNIVLTDTVGFIKDLPHDLVKAFNSTLEEIREASLLLHVVNVNWDSKYEIMDEVNKVLKMIKASHIPQILVFNQIDELDSAPMNNIQEDNTKVWVSAKTAVGIDDLKAAIMQQLYGSPVFRTIILHPEQSKLRAKLYQQNLVIEDHINIDGDNVMALEMSQEDHDRLESELGGDKTS